jgi:hypothetical protein
MNPDVSAFAQVSVIIVTLAGSLAAIAVASFIVVRRALRAPRPQHDDQRLEQLQHSVDAIAVEVERIAEAQRFTARLLAERAPAVSDSEIGARLTEPRRSVKG